ncbi:SGNH/GDSL hydrolase family protein [soil metagenome]
MPPAHLRLAFVALVAGAALATPALAGPDPMAWAPAWIFPVSSNEGPVSPPRTPTPGMRPDPRGPIGPTVVTDATLTQMFQVAVGGDRIRLRVSNDRGLTPLRLGAVTLGSAGEDGKAAAPGLAVTFDGATGINLPAGSSRLSDPIILPVKALDRLAVAVSYPGEAALPAHVVRQWMTTAADPLPRAMRLGAIAAGLEVETSAPHPNIIAFGDSITEGVGSTPGQGGWPEALNARMIAAQSPWTVLNAGLGGNRLLHQSTGPSALGRLDADALAVSNARCLILMEGINDIGRPTVEAFAHEAVTTDDITGAYRQIIERAHARGLRVVGVTLTPFVGAHYYSAKGETLRQAANAWIRTSGAFDAVIDFDAIVRDPASPARLRADYQSGDWLHPSDAGYAAMAEAIPLDVCD